MDAWTVVGAAAGAALAGLAMYAAHLVLDARAERKAARSWTDDRPVRGPDSHKDFK